MQRGGDLTGRDLSYFFFSQDKGISYTSVKACCALDVSEVEIHGRDTHEHMTICLNLQFNYIFGCLVSFSAG
jgi:hypothetical protein